MLFVAAGCIPTTVCGQEISGLVIGVIDGNTIQVRASDQEIHQILIHGIDSPEPGQSFHDQAKELLESLVLDKTVVVALFGRDRSGNRLGLISIKDSPDPRHEMVKAGLAWPAEKDPLKELESLKEQAKLQGRGLWKEENPVPPWTYRRQQTLNQSKSSD